MHDGALGFWILVFTRSPLDEKKLRYSTVVDSPRFFENATILAVRDRNSDPRIRASQCECINVGSRYFSSSGISNMRDFSHSARK